VGIQVKLCDSLTMRAISKRFSDKVYFIKLCCIKYPQLIYLLFRSHSFMLHSSVVLAVTVAVAAGKNKTCCMRF